METEKILMGQKQLQRWHLMKMVEVGKITLKEAGNTLQKGFSDPGENQVLLPYLGMALNHPLFSLLTQISSKR
jgi:hypothetical protein